MKIPIFDEVVVNKRHRARLAHIPHLPPGEKFAVPYAYEVDDNSGNIIKKLLASEGHFAVHSNEIIFRRDVADAGSTFIVFYEYENIKDVETRPHKLLIEVRNKYYKICYESLSDIIFKAKYIEKVKDDT